MDRSCKHSPDGEFRLLRNRLDLPLTGNCELESDDDQAGLYRGSCSLVSTVSSLLHLIYNEI